MKTQTKKLILLFVFIGVLTIITPLIVHVDTYIAVLDSAWFSILTSISIWIVSRGESGQITPKDIKYQLEYY